MLFRNKMAVILCCSFSSFMAVASPVNVNTASVEDIASALKGIGPAKAMAISHHCQKVTCHTAEDLLSVKGIGEKTLAKISMDLRFDTAHEGH